MIRIIPTIFKIKTINWTKWDFVKTIEKNLMLRKNGVNLYEDAENMKCNYLENNGKVMFHAHNLNLKETSQIKPFIFCWLISNRFQWGRTTLEYRKKDEIYTGNFIYYLYLYFSIIQFYLNTFVKKFNMEATKPKWINPNNISYGVNSLRLEGLHI